MQDFQVVNDDFKEQSPNKRRWPFSLMKAGQRATITDKADWRMAVRAAHATRSNHGYCWVFRCRWDSAQNLGYIWRVK